MLTREHGRLTLFARGVRGPRAKLAPVLQPFQPLLLSWSGRGEAPQLTGAERAEACAAAARRRCLLAAFYLNELLHEAHHAPRPAAGAVRSLPRHARARCAAAPPSSRALRIFEKRLLEVLGYGLDLGSEAHVRAPDRGAASTTTSAPAQGLVGAGAAHAGALAGAVPARAARPRSSASARALEDARRLLKAALGACLEGRQLTTRTVAPRHAAPGGLVTAPLALGVNIDHVATLRQARRGRAPDPVHAALLAESAGADSITLHLREDRRHIQDQDVRTLRGLLKTHMNLEMAVTEEMLRIALEVQPADVLPGARAARGGDHRGRARCGRPDCRAPHGGGRAADARRHPRVAVHRSGAAPDRGRRARSRAPVIELHTGAYADAPGAAQARAAGAPAPRPRAAPRASDSPCTPATA